MRSRSGGIRKLIFFQNISDKTDDDVDTDVDSLNKEAFGLKLHFVSCKGLSSKLSRDKTGFNKKEKKKKEKKKMKKG